MPPYKIVETLEDDPDKREVGSEAVWTLSSAKPGNGVEQLRDNNIDTFWQSDGIQPHLITIHFQRKMRLKEVAFYTDYKLDESYTPQNVSIKAGNSYHDVKQVQLLKLVEPTGWVCVPLGGGVDDQPFLKAHCLQIAILSSHQNGRDTHVRQVKVFAPRQVCTAALPVQCDPDLYTSIEFQQYACVR